MMNQIITFLADIDILLSLYLLFRRKFNYQWSIILALVFFALFEISVLVINSQVKTTQSS